MLVIFLIWIEFLQKKLWKVECQLYGIDYDLINKKDNKDILNIKFANNLRLEENEDLERTHQLNAKTSNFFGEIKFSPLNFLQQNIIFQLQII